LNIKANRVDGMWSNIMLRYVSFFLPIHFFAA